MTYLLGIFGDIGGLVEELLFRAEVTPDQCRVDPGMSGYLSKSNCAVTTRQE